MNIYIYKYTYVCTHTYTYIYIYKYIRDFFYIHIYTRVDIASCPCVVDESVPNRPPKHCKSLAH